MANVTITGLPTIGSMTDTSVMPIVVSGTTFQITGANMKTYMTSVPSPTIANGTSNVSVLSSGNTTINVGTSANYVFSSVGIRANGASPAPTLSGFSSANFIDSMTTRALSITGTSNLNAVGNVKITGGSNNQMLTTDGTGNLKWTSSRLYNEEYHVDPVNGDDANPGSYQFPVKTLSRALAIATTSETIILHDGNYAENVTITEPNIDIQGTTSSGALITISGNWTFNNSTTSVRVWSVNFQAGTTTTIAGAGAVYFRNCIHNGAVNKTGGGYVQIDGSAFQGTGFNATGAGVMLFQNTLVNFPTVNNAGAQLSIMNSPSIVSATVTSGIVLIDGSFIYSTTATANAVTGGAAGAVYLLNSRCLTPTQTAARVGISGFWSANDVQYDRANSTITGTNISSVSHFDAIQSVGSVIAPIVRTTATLFASLPSAALAGAGARAFITNANTTTFGSQVSGGGSNAMPVYSTGTNWFVG